MEYTIDTSIQTPLNWNASGDERIVQNVLNLLRTFRYDVGYDRTRGIDPRVLDMPLKKAQAVYISEVYRVIDLYEPRASVKSVKFSGIDEEEGMQFQVVIEI